VVALSHSLQLVGQAEQILPVPTKKYWLQSSHLPGPAIVHVVQSAPQIGLHPPVPLASYPVSHSLALQVVAFSHSLQLAGQAEQILPVSTKKYGSQSSHLPAPAVVQVVQ